MAWHPPRQEIRDVTVLAYGRLQVHFANGVIREYRPTWLNRVDGELVWPLRDPEYFARVTVDHGTLMWPNGLDVDPAWVYEESIPI